jgi:hypothetical protein
MSRDALTHNAVYGLTPCGMATVQRKARCQTALGLGS